MEDCVKAKDILRDESKWTQGAGARDANGNPCSVYSPNATRYCVMGAIMRAYSDRSHEEQAEAIHAVFRLLPSKYVTIAEWNDDPDRVFDDVRKILEKADV